MTAPARVAAHRVLRDVRHQRGILSHALERARRRLADSRDRALATEIAVGTLRWQLSLDAMLSRVSTRPLDSLDPDVLDLLRASVYQLWRLDRLPSHAVVDDGVTLTRELGHHRATGFVNAVLRAASRSLPTDALPPRPPDTASPSAAPHDAALNYLSVTLSHPRWLVERWCTRHGFSATERWLRFNNEPAPVTLAVNTFRISVTELSGRLKEAGLTVQPGRWSPYALVVAGGHPLMTQMAAEGLFQVQDEASQLIAVLVAAQPGDLVLDACASPGGKTLNIASAMDDNGLLIAGDVRTRRVAMLRDTVRRSRSRCVQVVQQDLRHPSLRARFDGVLVDAPCSGTGTLRRDPDLRWRRAPEDLPRLAHRQLTLLTAASELVKEGGRLVYATCSAEPEENADVVDRFLEAHPAFAREPAPAALGQLVNPRGDLETWPYRDELDAFYAASLKHMR